MNYPTDTEHEEMAQRQRKFTMKGYLYECFLFFLPSYIPHVSMHEKSRRLSALWAIWTFSMISAGEVPGSFDFCHHRGVDFAS